MPCSRLTPLSLQAEHHLIPLTSNPSELILLAAWLSGKTSRPPREPWLDSAPQAGAEGSPCSHRDQLLTDCQASPAVRLAVINPWFIIKTLLLVHREFVITQRATGPLNIGCVGWHHISPQSHPPSPGKRALQPLQQLPNSAGSPTHFVSTSSQCSTREIINLCHFNPKKGKNIVFFLFQGNRERPSKALQSNINDLAPNDFARETLKTESNPFI